MSSASSFVTRPIKTNKCNKKRWEKKCCHEQEKAVARKQLQQSDPICCEQASHKALSTTNMPEVNGHLAAPPAPPPPAPGAAANSSLLQYISRKIKYMYKYSGRIRRLDHCWRNWISMRTSPELKFGVTPEAGGAAGCSRVV